MAQCCWCVVSSKLQRLCLKIQSSFTDNNRGTLNCLRFCLCFCCSVLSGDWFFKPFWSRKACSQIDIFRKFNSHCGTGPLFTETEILAVTLLYFFSTAQLMYDVNYNFAPTNISKIFTWVKDIVHSYDTKPSSSDSLLLQIFTSHYPEKLSFTCWRTTMMEPNTCSS